MFWSENGLQISCDDGAVVRLPDAFDQDIEYDYVNPAFGKPDEIGSFEAYCIGRFGNDWIRELSEAISEKRIRIGKMSRLVGEPDSQFLSSAEVMRVEFSRLDPMRIYMDAVLAAEINVSAERMGLYRHDILSQWFRLRGMLTVSEYGYGVEGYDIVIYEKRDADPGQPLSKYLVPVLDRESIEDEADAILLRYYPEALFAPVPVDGEVLAKRMGLSIKDIPLVSEENVMGRAVFYDASVETEKDGVRFHKRIKPGSILINTAARMSPLQRNSTIIHECCHHYEHDLFVWAQKLYNDDIYSLENSEHCERYGKDSPLFWAERQAKVMTCCVKMNRLQTTAKVRELMAEYRHCCRQTGHAAEAEWLIGRVAEYFQTSKESARYRLEELGFPQARGVMNYANGRYIPAYFFNTDTLNKNQTFVVGVEDAVREFGRNEFFRELIGSGCYLYVEGKFCLNHKRYIKADGSGIPRMTDYARAHTDECCLRFEISYTDSGRRYALGQMNREQSVAVKTVRLSPESGIVQFTDQSITDMVAWTTAANKATMGMDFCETLCYLMAQRKVTIESLEERSELSVSTIKRLRNESEYSVTREQVVALAIGLHLPPAISLELMRKAGLIFRNTVLHNTYQMILCVMFMSEIHVVNEYLESQSIPPLRESTGQRGRRA